MILKEKKIRWVVGVPEGGVAQVKKGQSIKMGDVLVKYKEKKINLYSLSLIGKQIPPGELKAMAEVNIGSETVEGEVLGTKKKLWGKVEWKSPGSGIILGVDEFFNLMLETAVGEKDVRSPVAGKIVTIEKGRILVEFRAVEIKGEVLAEGKAWGETDFEEIKRMVDIDSQIEGKIMWLRKADSLLLTKGAVLGASGAVVTEGDEVGLELPVIKIDEKVWEELVLGTKRQARIWINSKKGRLLLVIE